MKRKIKLVLLFTFVIFSALTLAFGFSIIESKSMVFADGDTTVKTFEEDDGLLDEALFLKLKNYYNQNAESAGKSQVNKLTTDMFAIDYFEGKTLDLHGVEDEKIIKLENIDLFDLSKFSGINLSGNRIHSISTEFKNCNFSTINLSDNYIQEFDCLNINYFIESNPMTLLDLSDNLLNNCKLKEMKVINATPLVINLQSNYINVDKLTLPDDKEVEIKLSHNFIKKADLLEKVENDESYVENKISLGYQGPKINSQYSLSNYQEIEFYGFDELTQIKLQKADTTTLSVEDVLRDRYSFVPTNYVDDITININNKVQFEVAGYYKLVFTENEEEKVGLKKDITFYVMPNKPSVVMYKNGQKIDFTNKVNEIVEVKIENPQENVIYFFQNNQTGEVIVANSIKITEYELNAFNVYQIVNGCLSDKYVFSVNYQKSVALGWTYILIGVGIFGVVGYLIYIGIPIIATIGLGKKARKKKNLD